jgi:hypothetical protein
MFTREDVKPVVPGGSPSPDDLVRHVSVNVQTFDLPAKTGEHFKRESVTFQTKVEEMSCKQSFFFVIFMLACVFIAFFLLL